MDRFDSGAFEWLACEQDRFYCGFKPSGKTTLDRVSVWITIAVQPNKQVAQLKPGIFQTARQKVNGSGSGECSQVSTGLEYPKALTRPCCTEPAEGDSWSCPRTYSSRWSHRIEPAG